MHLSFFWFCFSEFQRLPVPVLVRGQFCFTILYYLYDVQRVIRLTWKHATAVVIIESMQIPANTYNNCYRQMQPKTYRHTNVTKSWNEQ